MLPQTFTTHSLPPTDQFEAWRAWYAPVFESTPQRPVDEGFPAKISTWILGGFTFSQVSMPPVNGARTRAYIRRNPVDHWVVTSYKRGTTRIETPDTSLEAPCGAPFVVSLERAAIQVNVALMERVRRVIGKHLRSPSLGPAKLCREAAVSRSHLYRLLETEGGVAHYIQRRRLSESFTLLSDAANTLSIGRIAESLCFADASSFSRAFRREFGMAPSDVRASSLAGLHPTASAVAGRHDINSFADCLRFF